MYSGIFIVVSGIFISWIRDDNFFKEFLNYRGTDNFMIYHFIDWACEIVTMFIIMYSLMKIGFF